MKTKTLSEGEDVEQIVIAEDRESASTILVKEMINAMKRLQKKVVR